MNKVLMFIVLFVGVFTFADKAEATVKSANTFKGFETVQNSPWDPREEASPTDDTGREDEPSQTEE